MGSYLVNLRLLANFILLVSLFGSMISALVIYMYDMDSLTSNSDNHNDDDEGDDTNQKKTNLNIITAKIFLYYNFINIIFGTFFLMFKKQNMLVSFIMGNIIYLMARILFANNFYFILQLPNIIGLMATSYRYYLDYYELDSKTTLHVDTELLRQWKKFSRKYPTNGRRKRRKRRRRRRKRSFENTLNDESDNSNEDTS